MKPENRNRIIQGLSILVLIWSIFDIFVHVRADMVEPLRVTGNIVAIAAALIALLGVAKSVAPKILGGAAAAVFLLNAVHSFQHGWGIAMLAFVGITILLLLLMGQMCAKQAIFQSGDSEAKIYHRWWMALLAAIVGTAIVAVLG